MAKLKGDVLLVGSVPLATAADVFKLAGETIGDRISCIPDGEIGDRVYWILYVAYKLFLNDPSIQTLVRPKNHEWKPAGLDDIFEFKLKDGVKSLKYGEIGYARAAADSYEALKKARAAGQIPADVRLQVAFPFPHDAVFAFFQHPEDYPVVMAAYEDALARELKLLFTLVPPKDLAVQFDVCTDLLEAEGSFYPWSRPETVWDRYVGPVRRLAPLIPADAMLGYHFCYGTFPAKPVIQPKNLDLSVRFANAAVAESGRRVDYMHLTVPIQRSDDAYFQPLTKLKAGDAKVFMGVVNVDGADASLKRLQAARKYLPDCGVAAECGFGREPVEKIPGLLAIHKDLAAKL